MSIAALDNLVKIRQLATERLNETEIQRHAAHGANASGRFAADVGVG